MDSIIKDFIQWDEGQLVLSSLIDPIAADGAVDIFPMLLAQGASNPGDESAFAATLIIDALIHGGPVAEQLPAFSAFKAAFPEFSIPELRQLAAVYLASYPTQSPAQKDEIAALRKRLIG